MNTHGKKSEKKGKSITFRIDGDLEKQFLEAIQTGASKTEVVNAALRRELPRLKEEFRAERLKKMGIPAANHAAEHPGVSLTEAYHPQKEAGDKGKENRQPRVRSARNKG